MNTLDFPPVEEVVEYLRQISRSKTVDEMLVFACTISVVPGSVGNTSAEVARYKEQINNGVVPHILQTWYQLVRPE